MNRVFLCGRLTRDPEVRYSSASQTAVAKFVLAVDRRTAKKEEGQQTADFVSCAAFGKTAEFFEKWTKQGTKMIIEGHIQTGSYTDREGRRVYTTEVIADQTEFAESRNGGGQDAAAGQTKGTDIGDGFMTIPDGVEDEGLPFN